MVELPRELLLDTRLIERHIARGLVSREDYEKALGALSDVGAKSTPFRVSMERIGIRNRRAEHTGENE